MCMRILVKNKCEPQFLKETISRVASISFACERNLSLIFTPAVFKSVIRVRFAILRGICDRRLSSRERPREIAEFLELISDERARETRFHACAQRNALVACD